MSEYVKKILNMVARDRNMWDKNIDINGDTYIFISSRNEFRRLDKSHYIGVLVGVWSFDSIRFIEDI